MDLLAQYAIGFPGSLSNSINEAKNLLRFSKNIISLPFSEFASTSL